MEDDKIIELITENAIDFISAVHRSEFGNGMNTKGDDFFLKLLFDHPGKYPAKIFELAVDKVVGMIQPYD
jgi:hypothetical protein